MYSMYTYVIVEEPVTISHVTGEGDTLETAIVAFLQIVVSQMAIVVR